MSTRTLNGRALGRAAAAVIIGAGLALACTDTPTGTTPTYTVGAMISGLTGSGLVLRDNGKDDLAISGNGLVTFATPIASGAAYRVTVFAQPSSPAQGCLVTGGSGTVSHANVTTVGIACTTNTYSVGVTVSGLVGSGLVLRNNGADDLPVSADGPVTFATPLIASADYSVTVLSQPMSPAQTCVITSGSGTVTDADVTTVAVACFLSGSASPLLVSSPVPYPSPASSSVRTARLSAPVVYVSLRPGTIPNGVSAIIRDLHTGNSVFALVVNGGFDPVVLSAVVGDTLALVVRTAGGSASSFLSVVAEGERPTVVRTDPPAHELDVPLNGLIVIVFSEPIDPATLTGSSVQLKQGAILVPGTVTFADPTQLRVRFTPDTHLAGNTDYQLVVTQAITDVNGLPLDSAITAPFTTLPPPPPNLVFASVSAGYYHICGVTTAGAAYCWGYNANGVLGDGTTTDHLTPVPVAGGLTFATVSAGAFHTCGLTTSGSAYCWGSAGLLGDGPNGKQSSMPVPVAGGHTFASVSAGYSHSCGVTTAGAAYCWGEGYYGELGVGSTEVTNTPTVVVGGLTFAAVSARGEKLSCGVTTTGAAYCWGLNTHGELGIGTSTGPEQCLKGVLYDCSTVPAAVAGGLRFQQVDAGGQAACGLTVANIPYCWGDNEHNLLGAGTNTGPEQCVQDDGGGTYILPCITAPARLSYNLFLRLTSVSVGTDYACGLTASDNAACWGDTPIAAGGGPFTAVSIAEQFGCGLTPAGEVVCWTPWSY